MEKSQEDVIMTKKRQLRQFMSEKRLQTDLKEITHKGLSFDATVRTQIISSQHLVSKTSNSFYQMTI